MQQRPWRPVWLSDNGVHGSTWGPRGPLPSQVGSPPLSGLNPSSADHTAPVNAVGEMAGRGAGAFRFTGHAGRLHTQN